MTTGFALNAGNTYKYTSNREVVLLYTQLGVSAGTVVDVKRLSAGVTEREISKGDYLQTEIDFRLPASNVGGGLVQPGYQIIDALGVAYVVLSVDPPSTYSAAWRCFCRFVTVLGLYNQVDYRPVVSTTDAYGDRISDYTSYPVKASYPARIQPVTADIEDLFGYRGLKNHFVIYVLPDIDLQFGDVFVDVAALATQPPQAYKVISWKSKQDLACALAILVERLPNG